MIGGQGIGLGEAGRTWLRIALLSFGGPAGQIALMHRILVDEKKWIDEPRFLAALNFCMLLPGPEAQQLATYIGWLMHRTAGGLIAGLLFILPGAAAIMLLSAVYALWGQLGPVSALFFGLKAAVLAIVLQAVVRIGARALGNLSRLAVAFAAWMALFFFAVPFPLVVLGAGLIGWAAGKSGRTAFALAHHGAPDAAGAASPAAPPLAWRVPAVLLLLWLAPVALLAWALPESPFAHIAAFFARMAVVSFGGAYAVLAYVGQAAVESYGWLSPREMMDGLGLAETTPGPLILVTQFVGFLAAYRDPMGLPPLLAGVAGGLLTLWVTFVPSFLWIFLGAPYMERLRHNRALASALAAITAAVVGVIVNLALWFALHVLFTRVTTFSAGPLRVDVPDMATLDPVALLLSAGSIVALFLLRAGVPLVLAGAASAGVLARAFG